MVFKYVNSDGETIDFDKSEGYVISKPKGVDSVSVSFKETQGLEQVGTSIQRASVQHRVINVKGKLCGADQRAKKRRLISVVRPDLEGRFYAGDYYVDCRPQETPAIEGIPYQAEFTFTLVAPYPYWKSSTPVHTIQAAVEPAFRLSSGIDGGGNAVPDWNISRQYQFGRFDASELITATNDGQLPVPFTARFLALTAVTAPKLEDVFSGKYLKLTRQMQAGETVEVEITNTRINVTSSVVGDIRGSLTLHSDLTRLDVGTSMLRPSCESGELEVDVLFRPELIGVST